MSMKNDERDLWGAFLADPSETNFIPIYEEARALVWTLCSRITSTPEDARDAFQAVWCRLFAELRSGVAEETLASGGAMTGRDYLCRLAVRESQNLKNRHLRRARREIAVDDLPETPVAEIPARERAARQELREQLETMVRLLPEEVRLPLQLHLFHGLSQDQVGRVLNLTQSTVSRRIARGLRRLESMIRKAGLTEALGGAAGIAAVAGAALLQPPEALGAAAIFNHVQATLAAGGAGAMAAGKGLSAVKISSGVVMMKVKMAIVTGVALLSLGGLIVGRQVSGGVWGAPAQVVVAQASGLARGSVGGSGAAGVKPSQAAGGRELAPRAGSTPSARVVGPMLTGRVLDAETKWPIAGAEITLDGEAKARTDSRGVFQITGAKVDQVELTTAAEGHASRYAVVNIPPAGLAGQSFELDPAMDVTVHVRDEEKLPVEGVTVQATGLREGFVDDVGKTNGAGEVVIHRISRLKPPSFSVKKNGYIQKTVDGLKCNSEKMRCDITFQLVAIKEMNRVVQGRIMASSGKPAVGVTVQWSPILGGQRGCDKTLTDDNGHYRLAFQNEAEDCRLSVYGEGWAPVIVDHFLTGTPAAPAERNFTLDRGHWLDITVVDEDGKPVKGARLEVAPEDKYVHCWSYPGVVRRVETAQDGKILLKDLSGPTVAIWMRGPAGENTWSEVWVSPMAVDRSVKLVARSAGVIAGRILDRDTGRPIPNFNIKLTGGSSFLISRMNPGETFNAPDGRFVLKQLNQGCKMNFTVEAPGYLGKSFVSIPVESIRGTPTDQVIRLTQGRPVRGVLVDATTKAPIRGAQLEFGVWNGKPFRWGGITQSPNVANSQKAVTGVDGFFQFFEDEPGTLFISAQDGHQYLLIRPEERARYAPSGGDTLWIPLIPGGSIHGVKYAASPEVKGNLGLIRMIPDPAGNPTAVYEFFSNFKMDEGGRFRVIL